MKTQEFLSLLENHKDKELLFEYLPGKIVPASYHITEVKHTKIHSVDCGGQTDAWDETVIQLWESPAESNKTEFMTVYKASSILKKVGRMRPYSMDAEVKIEYSNDSFHTAQLFIDEVITDNNSLIVKLSIKKTDCKAKEICGVPEPASMVEAEPCCSPDGNCC
ncbi:MAG: DUF6428 family protein [Flavobacteriaceae bacterium]|nr:DUF6428 family protein [Flavobacteriaceae bacterium]